MDKSGISYADLVSQFGIPLHMVMQWVTSPKDAKDLGKLASSDDFIRHARWFKNAMGEKDFETIMKRNIKKVKDPMSFLGIKEHLEETGALTDTLSDAMEERAEDVMKQLLEKNDIERLALAVDVSGSMSRAVKITDSLYTAL